MTAKEKILADIVNESVKKAESIINDAKIKAEEDTENSLCKAQTEAEKIIADAEKKALAIVENANSSARLLKRNSVLKYKSEAIEKVLDKTLDRLNSYSDKDYFDCLFSLAQKNALSVNGLLFLNEKDLSRNTNEFKEKIQSLKLELSDEPQEILGGFMLQYGDIIINCAFEALIHEKREQLTDAINKAIFN